jgi:hypothetical protein
MKPLFVSDPTLCSSIHIVSLEFYHTMPVAYTLSRLDNAVVNSSPSATAMNGRTAECASCTDHRPHNSYSVPTWHIGLKVMRRFGISSCCIETKPLLSPAVYNEQLRLICLGVPQCGWRATPGFSRWGRCSISGEMVYRPSITSILASFAHATSRTLRDLILTTVRTTFDFQLGMDIWPRACSCSKSADGTTGGSKLSLF